MVYWLVNSLCTVMFIPPRESLLTTEIYLTFVYKFGPIFSLYLNAVKRFFYFYVITVGLCLFLLYLV